MNKTLRILFRAFIGLFKRKINGNDIRKKRNNDRYYARDYQVFKGELKRKKLFGMAGSLM